MMLIGIAAGPQEKVTLGDVVAANWVYDYEHVRREKNKGKKIEKPRPFHIPVPKNISADLELYEEAWLKNRLQSVLAQVDAYTLPVPPAEINPRFHVGTIAAGEKLFADNSLDELRSKYDDEIRAGDQEDSGFAQACDFRDIPWCIFRGISDYGDATKNKEWHSTASLAAASAAYAFLQHAFRVHSERF
jgi:nucleoside phosphorylase